MEFTKLIRFPSYKQISQRQADEEQIGEFPQRLVRLDGQTDQEVAHHRDEDQQDEEEGQQPGQDQLHGRGSENV